MFLLYNTYTCMTYKSKNNGCDQKLIHTNLRHTKKEMVINCRR